jgi:hypothetical protein
LRDAAREFHSRGPKAEHHWSGIRANRLSSQHGEFCKLFCSHTSRELDFFNESGNRSGEQLLNMIDLCTVFSLSRSKECIVFRSLFNIDSNKVRDLQLALEAMRKAAVGHQKQKSGDLKEEDLKEEGVRHLRNKLFHDFLTISPDDFHNLVACSKQLLDSVRTVISCLCEKLSSECVQQALDEIDAIVKRDLTVAKLSDDEYDDLHRRNQQMLEELEKLKSRKFDSVAVCLKHDIQEFLNPSVYAAHVHRLCFTE